MDIKKIIKEELDEFDWIRDTNTSIKYVEDIKYNLHRPFRLYNLKKNKYDLKPGSNILDGIFWIKENETSPIRYDVCWNTSYGEDCTSYNASDIVENFDEDVDYVWVWRFI